jgi:hypothetical protein
MDLTVDVLSEEPWGKTYYERRMGFNQFKRNVKMDAQFKLTQDRPQTYWKRADMVVFGTGYYRINDTWREWFMEIDDYLENLRVNYKRYRNKSVPLYARLQFGLVVSRYKWVKQKDFGVFSDRGTIIMMLTGKKAGHVRRFYPLPCFKIFSRYPYDKIVPFQANVYGSTIPEKERIQEAMKNNEDKDQFILNMIESYQNP